MLTKIIIKISSELKDQGKFVDGSIKVLYFYVNSLFVSMSDIHIFNC